MKTLLETGALICMWAFGFLSGLFFNIFVGSFLIWKIFNVSGAQNILAPTFYLMFGSIILCVSSAILAITLPRDD